MGVVVVVVVVALAVIGAAAGVVAVQRAAPGISPFERRRQIMSGLTARQQALRWALVVALTIGAASLFWLHGPARVLIQAVVMAGLIGYMAWSLQRLKR